MRKCWFLMLLVALLPYPMPQAHCLAPRSGFAKDSVVERPATYEVDEYFWREAEKHNPGLLEKVKRVITTYFDDTTVPLGRGRPVREPLRAGVDYDFISGRNVIITLETPVLIRGIMMKELSLKGAPFKKSDEGKDYYPTRDLSKESIEALKESGNVEFDRDGNILFEKIHLNRLKAKYYANARNEYEMGRDCFEHDQAAVQTLPVMNARYDSIRGGDGSALGVVVIASPTRTKNFFVDETGYATKNRVGHLLGIFWEQLKTRRGDPLEIGEDAKKLSAGFGYALRRFHDAGYTHGNPHSGNVVVDLDTWEIHIVDLSEARKVSQMSPEQAFGYRLRDVQYASQDLVKGIVSSKDREDLEFHVGNLRSFVVGYLGVHGIHYQLNDDKQMLTDVCGLHDAIMNAANPRNFYRVRITAPVILQNPLATMIYRMVFDPGREQVLQKMFGGFLGFVENPTETSL